MSGKQAEMPEASKTKIRNESQTLTVAYGSTHAKILDDAGLI